MQRIAARAATSLVLAVALTLAATVSASASRSPRPIQRSASFRSTQRYVPSRFAIPSSRQLLGRASGSATALIGNFKVLGSPYRWGFAAVTSGTRPFLIVFGGKTLINGVEEHEWRFELPADAFHMGRRLRVGRVHTDTALGPFGQIDLTFRPHGSIRSRSLRCWDTHDVLETDYMRRGTLTGSFQFSSNEGTLPALDVTTMKARAQRGVSTGARCPRQGHPTRCVRFTSAGITSATQGTAVFGEVRQDLLFGTVNQVVAPAEEFDLVIANTAGSHVFAMGPNGSDVDASMLAPFASGNLAFVTTSTARRKGHRCGHVVHQKQAWTAGTLSLTLDSGTVDLTGSDLRGLVVTHER